MTHAILPLHLDERGATKLEKMLRGQSLLHGKLTWHCMWSESELHNQLISIDQSIIIWSIWSIWSICSCTEAKTASNMAIAAAGHLIRDNLLANTKMSMRTYSKLMKEHLGNVEVNIKTQTPETKLMNMPWSRKLAVGSSSYSCFSKGRGRSEL